MSASARCPGRVLRGDAKWAQDMGNRDVMKAVTKLWRYRESRRQGRKKR